MPPLTLRRCVPIASSTAPQRAHRRMPRMWGIRRCAHVEEFFRFREAKRWENSFQASATDLRAGMGKMSIVRTVTEVPGTGHPSLSALWDAMGLAIGKLGRSVSAGIGQIGVLSPFPMRPHYFLNRAKHGGNGGTETRRDFGWRVFWEEPSHRGNTGQTLDREVFWDAKLLPANSPCLLSPRAPCFAPQAGPVSHGWGAWSRGSLAKSWKFRARRPSENTRDSPS
jgi:hypothetical protein